MSRLGGFDGLEVALLGEVGGCTVSREVGGAGLPCGRVEFLSEEGKQGGPPGLRVIGRAFGGGVEGEESGEAGEVSVEPGTLTLGPLTSLYRRSSLNCDSYKPI